jgi:AAA+ ATPase superfamily predicted ATPase
MYSFGIRNMPKFINREEELSRLRALYEMDQPELAIVYGRRRIGKTALVIESIRNRDSVVYHQAVETTQQDQIETFIDDASEVYPGVSRLKHEWETILRYLAEQDAVIILDEFPFLAAADESLPSTIQRLWDHAVQDTSTTFVLTGSAIGMMYDLAIGGGAPLYGRVSQVPNGEISVEELPFVAVMEFFPSYSPEGQVFAYGVFGGTPHYLRAIDDARSLKENITRTLLSQQGGLHNEPETVLRMELDEVSRYFALLKAMAEGTRERNELAQETGIESMNLSYYLDRLEALHIIRKDHPVTVDPMRSRKTRYRIKDDLFRFWFRFIYGQETRYDLYRGTPYEDLIEPELPDFVSNTFEKLCQAAVPTLYSGLTFTKPPDRWWHKHREIDVVGITDSDTLLVGEAKFTNQPVGYDVLSRLEENAHHVEWSPSGGGEPRYMYALFTRNGFKRSVREAAEERDDLRLFSIADVQAALT